MDRHVACMGERWNVRVYRVVRTEGCRTYGCALIIRPQWCSLVLASPITTTTTPPVVVAVVVAVVVTAAAVVVVVVIVVVVVKECLWTPLKAYREQVAWAPAVLLWRKVPRYPLNRMLSGRQRRFECYGEEKKSFGSVRNQTVQSQCNNNNNNNNNNFKTKINLKDI